MSKKFVHVFLYTKPNEKPPIISNIGDIILLNRFLVKIIKNYSYYFFFFFFLLSLKKMTSTKNTKHDIQ